MAVGTKATVRGTVSAGTARSASSPVVSHRLESELADRRRGRRRRWQLIGLMGVAVVATALFVLLGPVLVVRDITVTGTDRVSSDQVVAASGLQAGERFVGIDPPTTADRVQARLPPVARAQVHRGLTGTVRIAVAERTAVATTTVDGAGLLLAADGVAFAPVDPVRDTGLPTVSGGAGADLVAALTALSSLPADVRASVAARVGDGGSLSLTGPRGVTVEWGRPGRDDRQRAQTLTALLGQPDRLPDGATLDLSVPGVVTVR